jgi:hypothetical protein
MKKFYWIDKDYQNESLNNLAKRVVEYNTANLISYGFEITYSKEIPADGSPYAEVGKIEVSDQADEKGFDHSVADVNVINDIFNYNLYFVNNTEDPLMIKDELKGTFDCLVSLAAGDMIERNPEIIGLIGSNHYVIDISPTAIHKSMNLYKDLPTGFIQVDIFNTDAVKEFLKTCKGTKGFFVVSNCFCYIVNSLLYDVNLRLKIQNEFIDILANDKIEWYVSMFSADGTYYHCDRAIDIQNKILDKNFKELPWIKK